LDWRGRAYPVPLYLQPQGSDLQRGLLTFADGLPISNQLDADWLAIHGAGCFGFDKVSLEERVQWVKDHHEEIMASAQDPYSNSFWTEADKPWQFLAFCMEWYGFSREGFGYVSDLPVQMDGTCNGLQNFSAMLLDEVGGAAVNLIPADKPQDIYQRVADIVIQMVAKDLFNEDSEVAFIARGWHGNITRKVTKRPVMTLAYGAKRFGFVGQIEEDTLREWREREDYPFIATQDEGKVFDFGYKAAMYMAGLIWEAVGQVVVAARAAMDWLQKAAQAVSKVTIPTFDGEGKQGMPINWVTPSGLLVQQAYRVPNMKRIDTAFHSTRIRLHHADARRVGKIDARRQASGISPNWVHSLDASHMMATLCRSKAEGIAHFSMIHDSYGTHAANAAALATFLREEFVQMYSNVDVLATFKEDLEYQMGATLPTLPAKGKLDLNEVLSSSFFFA
jgi:DNA-directed RNA polymerase